MVGEDPDDVVIRPRRVPQQARSRERVERILDAAAELVVTGGVEALSTRAIAERAAVPVASLYQYFADKDEILLALVERDIADMDQQVAADVAALAPLTIPAVVESVMRAYVTVYRRRPAFVVIWLRGRTNQAIRHAGRDHNRRLAAELFSYARDAGLLNDAVRPQHAELAVEIGDRLLQLAFENDLSGDEELLGEGVAMVTAYLTRYADPAGRS